MFTQEQLEALNQSIRGKRIKIEVLNYNFKIIDTIEGEATDGTIDMDATSDYRMSCNLTMVVDSHYTGIVETKYLVDKGNIIWLDKYIKIYVGIDDIYTGETVWYNRGIYIIDEPSYSYSITQSMLKISGMDLMFNLSDKRRGQLTDYETKIIVYDEQTGVLTDRVSMRETFINILNTYTNITKYYLAPMTGDLEYLPENLTFEAGITIYDMLSKLLSYLPGWEMFFDLDGIFTVQPIPSGVNDIVYPLDINNTSMEEISVDFSNVKNLIVVRGRTHDCDYFTQNTTDNPNNVDIEIDSVNGNALKLVVDGTIELNNNITLGFLWLDNTYNPEFRRLILNGTEYQLCDFEKTNQYIPENTFQPGSINVIRFVYKDNLSYPSSQNYWDYLSNDQANAFAVNDILDNPFYINAELKGENYYGGLTYCADHVNYEITLNNERTLSQINDGVQITLMPNILNDTNPTLTVKDGISGNTLLSQKPLVDKLGVSLLASQWYGDNTIYIIKYDESNDEFVLQGRLQTFTAYLSGGEYENIYSNSLAKQRAEYELYLHSNLNDQVSINSIPNYCMDVNKKIKYRNFTSDDEEYYLIKTLSLPLATTGATMSINAMKLYPPKYYITTQLTGCTLNIVDENGNEYSNGDIIKENTRIIIYASALEGYTDTFVVTINGNSYTLGTIYKTSGDVNIIANAIPV